MVLAPDEAEGRAAAARPAAAVPLVRTFLHLTGIGPARERMLWEQGIASWDDLGEALRNGIRPADLLREARGPVPGQRPPPLHAHGPPGAVSGRRDRQLHPEASLWLYELEHSRRDLAEQRFEPFLEKLEAREHWRVLASCPEAVLWLDIETTGIDPARADVTVVGVLGPGGFENFVRPTTFEELAARVEAAPLIGTYNGRAFDIPFLRARVPGFPRPRAHVDLMPICRAAGRKGGQKAIERALGLDRDEDLMGMGGGDAVKLWALHLAGHEGALELLLRYNRADVEMMPRIATRVVRELAEAQGLPLP
jgi:uncharacterized protein YprB with RNaseH-like and TPR domain